MAQLFNLKSEIWNGEAFVYNAIQKFLPDGIVCYYNGQILNHTFDYCLVIKDLGILIIEVKGWMPDHIEYFDDIQNKIYIKGYQNPCSSPKAQADGYRYGLVHILNNKYNINPLIASTVCYPFINENQFLSLGLKGFSELDYTIVKEDLSDQKKFIKKISNIFKSLISTKTDKLNGVIYDTVRKHFESNYQEEEVGHPYSSLTVFNNNVSIVDYKHIFEEYAVGIKQTIFVRTKEELKEFENELNQFYDDNELFFNGSSFMVNSGNKSQIKINRDKIISFLFEVYLIDDSICNSGSNLVIENGHFDDNTGKILKRLSEVTDFNFEQYLIEHSSVDKNIQIKAGAGTGKTFSMINRISYLCNKNSKSGVIDLANEIAMLTFTDEAAINMRKRIKQQFLNYFSLTKEKKYLDWISAVERMRISTIHSFAKDIISRTSLPLGIGSDFVTISGIYNRRQILKKHLSAFFENKFRYNQDYVFDLNIPNMYDLEKYLLDFSNKCYSKGIDVKTLTKDVLGQPVKNYEYIVDLIIDVLREAEIEYSNLLLESNSIHLNEYMIYLKKCIEHESFNPVLYNFKFLFIDEFQDVDDGQIDIFKKLNDKIELKYFIVGDLKQSIYRFRGATMDAFSKMGCYSPNWNQFSLSKNYRSDKRLLMEFDKVFKKLGEINYLPYSCDDMLIGVKMNQDINQYFYEKIIISEDYDEKYDLLFDAIVKRKNELSFLMKTKTLSNNERKIAILVRNNSDIRNILLKAKMNNKLIENHISIVSDKNSNLYSLQSTIDLCKLTSALCNPYNINYLFDLVMSNNVNVKFYPINLINKSNIEKRDILINCLDSFYQSIMKLNWIELVNKVQTQPTLKILREIYESSMPWKKYSNDYDKQIHYRINYEALFEELSRTNKYNYLTLDSINESLYINITSDNEAKSREIDKDNDDIEVVCMTVHASKGLEFDTVILPEVSKKIGNFKNDSCEISYDFGKLGYCFNFKFDKDDIRPICNEFFDEKNEHIEIIMEETRILYVALTRAINKFIWIGKEYKNKSLNDFINWNKLLDGEF